MHKKSCYTPFLTALILTTLCALNTPAQEEVIAHFPDKNLETAIREAINKPQGDILQTDLVGTGFTEFIACWRCITDLTGLENCTDLTTLILGHNEISDISALVGLTNLEDLVLSGNQIGDIHALADLTNLEKLYLQNNPISDVSPLGGLPDLTDLTMGGNPIPGVRSWITIARIECRRAWRDLTPTERAVLVRGSTFLIILF